MSMSLHLPKNLEDSRSVDFSDGCIAQRQIGKFEQSLCFRDRCVCSPFRLDTSNTLLGDYNYTERIFDFGRPFLPLVLRRVNTLGEETLGVVARPAGILQRGRRIRANFQQLLLAAEALGQAP
jgi:hypothetical protein